MIYISFLIIFPVTVNKGIFLTYSMRERDADRYLDRAMALIRKGTMEVVKAQEATSIVFDIDLRYYHSDFYSSLLMLFGHTDF